MHRCIHTNPIKKPADIDHAYAAGIRTFVVENACEAQKFAGRPADIELLVRLAFRNPAAKSDLSSKFGAELSDAELLVKHVLAAGVQFAGFSFHVGSQSPSAEPFRVALEDTLHLVAHLRDALGLRTRVLDIGGGFPVSYREQEPPSRRSPRSSTSVLGGPGARAGMSSPCWPSRVDSWPPTA